MSTSVSTSTTSTTRPELINTEPTTGLFSERPLGSLDPRGPRFAATVTSAALAAVLLLPTPASIIVLTVVVAAFTQGAVRGVQATPQAWLFRTLVRPRLSPTTNWESPVPARFAQAVGLAFALGGLIALLTGLVLVGQIAVGVALVAALLNAAFGFCLGCELFVISRSLRA